MTAYIPFSILNPTHITSKRWFFTFKTCGGQTHFCLILKTQNNLLQLSTPSGPQITQLFLQRRKGDKDMKESTQPVSQTKLGNIFRKAWSDTLMDKRGIFPSLDPTKWSIGCSHWCPLILMHRDLSGCQCAADWAVIVLNGISSFYGRVIGNSSI